MNIFGANIDLMSYVEPGLMFIVMIVIGLVLGVLSGAAVKHLLRKSPFRLDERLRKWKLDDAIGHLSISKILGSLTKWFIFSIFLGQASAYIRLGVVTDYINLIVLYIPQVIIAVIIVLTTLILADFVSDKIRATKNKIVDLVGIIVKPLLVIFGLIIAADQLGIKLDFGIVIIQDIIRALAWGIALAFGLAFGLGYGLDKKNSRSVLPEAVESAWKKIK